jgi:hypothetical protein
MSRKLLSGLIVLAMLGAGGCFSEIPEIRAKMQYKPVECKTPQIMLKPAVTPRRYGKLAMAEFTEPRYARGVGSVTAEAYFRELLGSGMFSEIAFGEDATRGSSPGDNTNYTLKGSVLYFLAGSGDTPTRLVIEIQISDASRHEVVWYVRQEAYSQAEPDVNMIWYTAEGERPKHYEVLAEALGRQLVQLMTPPPVELPSKGSAPPDPFITNKNSFN